MRALALRQIPVVDREGKLMGLQLMEEMLGRIKRANWGVIMAGGRGTRLRPMTESLPKPLVRVAGRPILERLVLHLVGYGIERIFLAVNYLGHMIEDHFGDGSKFGCRIEYLREREEMGTGGSLSLLPEPPRDPLLVLNGDLVTQANLDDLFRFHGTGGYTATVALKRYVHRIPFGCLDVEAGRVRRFEEKPVVERCVNAGLYVLAPALPARVPRSHFPLTGLIEACLAQGEPVGAFEVGEDWIDVGERDHLREAQEGTA
jgi:NDP-sugar pyrophosphorylase family protein